MEYTKCRISSLALAKISKYAAEGGSTEVMGMLLGSASPPAFTVTDCFALPVEATETRVNAMGEAYEYIVKYVDSLENNSGKRPQIVGWYHSHPGYGCFLSRIDINTQSQNQQFQDPFVAIVIDPIKTREKGVTEIGAFRTKNNQFVTLEVTYFSSKLDAPLLTSLDREKWIKAITEV